MYPVLSRVVLIIVGVAVLYLASAPATIAGATLVQQAQERLVERGYDPGPVDGLWGPKTRNALMQFQRDHGLEATGELNARTRAELGVDAAPAEGTSTIPKALVGKWIQIDSLGDTFGILTVTAEDLAWERPEAEREVHTKADLIVSPQASKVQFKSDFVYSRHFRYKAQVMVSLSVYGDSLILETDSLYVKRKRPVMLDPGVKGVKSILYGDNVHYIKPVEAVTYKRVK